jgi:hypothetical protein
MNMTLRRNFFIFSCIAILISLLGCAKKAQGNSAKDEVKPKANDDSASQQIADMGNDEYIAGSAGQDTSGNYKTMPCLWVNGDMKILDLPDFEESGEARTVIKSGDDIVVSGYAQTGKSDNFRKSACVWKNGIPVLLETNSYNSEAAGLFVGDTDIFACGYVSDDAVDQTISACYWQNGKMMKLPPLFPLSPYTRTKALAIVVKGTDSYIAGFSSDGSNNPFPCYWENGVRIDLAPNEPGSGSYSCNLAVSGKSVYVTGSTGKQFPKARKTAKSTLKSRSLVFGKTEMPCCFRLYPKIR